MEGFNDITELPGVGKYGKESWDIFVNGRTDIEPTDKKLKKYLEILDSYLFLEFLRPSFR